MPIESIDHIGIAVRDLDQAIGFYCQILGLALAGIEEVPDQMVKVAVFPVGSARIELLAPTDPRSPIAKFLDKRGEGIHHLALAVDDVPAALGSLAGAGCQLIDQAPRPGAQGSEIAFVHPHSTAGVLLELCGRDRPSQPES